MPDGPNRDRQSTSVNEVDLEKWGTGVLEEVLFQAAMKVPGSSGDVRVELIASVGVEATSGIVRVSLARAAEAPLVTNVVPPSPDAAGRVR